MSVLWIYPKSMISSFIYLCALIFEKTHSEHLLKISSLLVFSFNLEKKICDTFCLFNEHLFFLSVIDLCYIEIICFDRKILLEQIMVVFILVMFISVFYNWH